MSIPKPLAGRTLRPSRRTPPSRWGHNLPLTLERLEDRATPSTNIPLSGTTFTSIGPGPISPRSDIGLNNTSSPGALNSTGRINDIATQPLQLLPGQVDFTRATYVPDPAVIYVASAGGGVAKTLNNGATWEHLTDRLTNVELGLPPDATAETSATRRTLNMGSVAISPNDPNVIYAGEGDEFGGAGHGILKTTDGGTTWTLIQGPMLAPDAGTGAPLFPTPAFDNVVIPKIVALRNPAVAGQDLLYAMVQAGNTGLPELWRSGDGGTSWTRVTVQLTTAQEDGGNGIGYDKSFVGLGFTEFYRGGAPFTDFNVDSSDPNIVYVAVGEDDFGQPLTASYSLNGIYKTENALSATPSWVVAFGGSGTFVPGSLLGRIEFSVAPSRPSVLYAAIGKGTTDGLLGVYRSQDSGINWVQIPNLSGLNFLVGQDFYNLAIAVDPLNPANVYLGGNDFRNGNGSVANPSDRVIFTSNGLAADPALVQFGRIAIDPQGQGPHEDIHTFQINTDGKFLVGCDGGIFETPAPTGSGKTFTVDWASLAGNPGFRIDINGRQVPTALNVTQVQGIGLHPSSAETMLAGMQDNGLAMFRDTGDLNNTAAQYGWATVNGGDVGNVVYDFVNPNNVYHIAPVASYGAANYVQKSTDGGRTWKGAAAGLGNTNHTLFYPPLEIDPSNPQRLLTGTDNVYVTKDGAANWAPLAGKNLGWVTGIPSDAPGSPPNPLVTAIGVGRFDGNVVYAAVNSRYMSVSGGYIVQGPALYRIDIGITQPNDEPGWRDRSPGLMDIDRLPGLNDPVQKTPMPNSLTGSITDIAVDPFDSNNVVITSGTEVWYTQNAGIDWNLITRNLPQIGATTIAIDPNRLAGPSDDEIYVGLSNGIWRLKDPTSATSKWEDIRYNGPIDTAKGLALYEGDLPDAAVTDIEINTTTGILAVATNGRGVYQYQIRPLVTGFKFEDEDGDGRRDVMEDTNKNGVLDLGEDRDGDGRLDKFEAGLDNVTIIARIGTVNGPEQASTVTRSDALGFFQGYWEFRSLPDQVYYISEAGGLSKFEQTTPPIVFAKRDATGTLVPGTNNGLTSVDRTDQLLNQQIGNFQRVTISGVKFDDRDGDGTRDAGEPGLPGFIIRLLDIDGNPVLDGAGVPRQQTTDANGNYAFTGLGLIPGQPVNLRTTYRLAEIQQTGFVATVSPGQIMVTSGDDVTTADFGNFRLMNIRGLKFNDLNGNGVFDSEPRLGNWVFGLFDSNDAPIIRNGIPYTSITNTNGEFFFDNLPPIPDPLTPGQTLSYRVREVVMPGFEQLTPTIADIPPQSGQTITGDITMTGPPFVYEPTLAVGNFRLVTINGSVLEDTDGNGVLTGTETNPVGGGFAVLQYTDAGTVNVVQTVPVLADGSYSFTNVKPVVIGGQVFNFMVTLQPATGFVQTTADPASFLVTSGNSTSVPAFGVFEKATIAGIVFEDINGNGVQDGSEAGIQVPGTTVQLVAIRDDGTQVAQGSPVAVGPAGKYQFTNLGPQIAGAGSPPVQFAVVIATPTGFTATSPLLASPMIQSDSVSLSSGAVLNGPFDFGEFKLTSISGIALNDLNGDGTKQTNETGGVAGTKVALIDTRNGKSITTVITGKDGSFTFPNLPPLLTNGVNAAYRVTIAPPEGAVTTGYVSTGKTTTDAVLSSGVPVVGLVYPEFKLFAVSGTVYNDVNGDGVRGKSEPGLGSFTVTLTNLGTGAKVSVVSDKSGSFTFPALGPGTYSVRETPLAGFIQTSPNPADIPGVSGTDVPGNLFGNFKLVDLTGAVIEDLDRDGVLEAGEPGRSGFTITLLNSTTGATVATTTTASDGSFAFAQQGPGKFDVRVTLPESWIQTNANPATITTVSGVNVPNNSFGVLRLGSITGTAFIDANRNGTKDAREKFLPNLQVTLRDPNDNIVRQAVTDANGSFSFINLDPNTYRLQIPEGTGFILTDKTVTGGGIPLVVTSGSTTTTTIRTGLPLGVASIPVTVVGADAGGGPNVKVFNALTQETKFSFFAFEDSFTGGVRVAQGDVTGDGIADYIVTAGPTGGPVVRVFDGLSLRQVYSFFAYEKSFTGGLFVAAGDVNGDGVADIITGTDIGGGPRVQVFDGLTRAVLQNYFAYEQSFRGGVRVAAGDVNGDGVTDIITTPAEGGGPRVNARSGVDGSVLANFFAFDKTLRAGVFVAAGDLDADGTDEIIVGQGKAVNPGVQTYNAAGVLLASERAFPPDENGNVLNADVRVGVTDRFGDGNVDVVVTSGPGTRTRLRFLDRNLQPSADELRPYDDAFSGGVFVG